jgi:DNA polymerase-3 subunit epsilon
VKLVPRLGGLRGRQGRSVPGWAAFELDWREAELLVVDLEATGLDLRRDDIVSYGAVIVRAGRVVAGSTVYGLVKPRREVSAAAIAVHALTASELACAPPLSHGAGVLAELLAGRVLVAHAAWVETAFLRRAFAPIGVRLDGPVVDTAALARAVGLADLREDAAEPSLERLAGSLGLPVHTPHHALGDALTTAGLLLALVARLEADAPQTIRSLVETSHRQSRRR